MSPNDPNDPLQRAPQDGLPQDGLPQDFETALAELEALVADMESGAQPLEASLAAYRRGVALSRICQDRLAQAEQQVKVLEGELLRPFEGGGIEAEGKG
ncbi:exodeoxyribonuclease VII small subunit [Orrella sp. JC864]|uniref:exodeoxyribonuclease VII small subunit n=1 Tax=Orrella sp. JC864 TaxID=3120298 RepID=UPI0030085EFF